MNQNLNEQSGYKSLAEAILKLKTEEEVLNFLRDLCTIAELKSMTERLEVAKKVQEGLSYREINKLTGVSTATITRVAHWLHHGMGGYKLILERT